MIEKNELIRVIEDGLILIESIEHDVKKRTGYELSVFLPEWKRWARKTINKAKE